MPTRYVHVRHANGADDMIPEQAAAVLADAGMVKIIDATPGPYRQPKPRVPLGTKVGPKQTRTTRVVTEPAPAGAPDEPEEATK